MQTVIHMLYFTIFHLYKKCKARQKYLRVQLGPQHEKMVKIGKQLVLVGLNLVILATPHSELS